MSHRLFRHLLCLALITLSASRVCAYDFKADGVFYERLTDSTVVVTIGDGLYQGDVVIPGTVTHNDTTYAVVAFDPQAFYYSTAITSVSLQSDSVLPIYDRADSLRVITMTYDSVPPPSTRLYAPLYVPKPLLEAYQQAPYWSSFWHFVGTNFMMGDVNCDGIINADDVTTLIDILLGEINAEEHGYQPDVTEDSLVNSDDVSVLISLLLGESYTGANVYVDHDLGMSHMRILCLGNSYSVDQLNLLRRIYFANGGNKAGIQVFLASRSGASFKNWVDVFNGVDSAETYTLYNEITYISLWNNVKIGQTDGSDSTNFIHLVDAQDWDYVVLQQYSKYARAYSNWKTRKVSGYMDSLITLIRQHQPNATLAFTLIHSYWDDYYYGSTLNHSSYDHWGALCAAARQLQQNDSIETIIPYGTAIENLRMSSYNNTYDLTRDGTHLGYDLARYTATCCWYQKLLAPYTGVSVNGNTFRYTAKDDERSNTKYKSSLIAVTDATAPIAHRAAILAVDHPYECINPETTNFLPSN